MSGRCLPKAFSAANLLLLLCHLTHPTAATIILSQIRPPHTHQLSLQVTLTGPANSNTLPSSSPAPFSGTSGRSLPHCHPMGHPPVLRMVLISSWQSVLCSWNMPIPDVSRAQGLEIQVLAPTFLPQKSLLAPLRVVGGDRLPYWAQSAG